MSIINLIGIDPGIVDTGAVCISMDVEERQWTVLTDVYSNVTSRDGFQVIVDTHFLDDLAAFTQDNTQGLTLIGIEGYRQRGKNQRQDQAMLHLVQTLRATVPGSVIVDNTGIKKTVTQKALELFRAHRFKSTNHADLKSAARVALLVGLKHEEVNMAIAGFMTDQLGGRPWEYVSTKTW